MADQAVLKLNIDIIIKYLDSLLPLANCHTVDFITKQLWKTLIPAGLREEVEIVTVECLYKRFKDYEDNICLLGPASITDTCSNSNEFMKIAPNFIHFLAEARNMSLSSFSDLTLTQSELRNKLLLLETPTHNAVHLNQFMSQKKTHEVEVMSELVASLANTCQVSHVVDVGSGKGYLSSMLASHHKLSVLGIDSSQINSHGAAKRTKRLQRAGVVRKSPKADTNKPHSTAVQDKVLDINVPTYHEYKQATVFVTQETDLLSLMNEHFPGTEPCKHLALVGLHTCGNLSSTALHLFSNSDQVSGLCNVGCCYHLIREEFCETPFQEKLGLSDVEYGFPMSSYLKLKEFSLGRNARMLAAQSLERISEKTSQAQQSIESLYRRALLQVLLVERCCEGSFPQGHVGRLAAKCSNFTEYIMKALKKLGVDVKVSETEIEHLYASHEIDHRHLQIFFLLRLCLAPVIEGLILLDRLLYLLEQDKSEAFLVKMFDPLVSPRCYGIVAIKR